MAVMTIQQWSMAFLRSIGNLNPVSEVQAFVNGWVRHEGGGGSLVSGSTNSCNGNGLNTCQSMPGSIHCPSSSQDYCVQSYLSNNDGIYANVLAIRNGLYPHLLAALLTNDTKSLGMEKGSQMTPEIVRDLSNWVNGPNGANDPGYAQAILNAANAQGGVSSSAPSGTSDGKKNTTSGTGGNMSSSSSGSGNPVLDWLLGSPVAAWIANPIRVLKMIGGLLLIGAALFLLISPDPVETAKAALPLVL